MINNKGQMMTLEQQNAELLRQNAELVAKNHKLKTRLRAMQECAIGSQDWNWLEANDDTSDPSGLHISFMRDLRATAHSDHRDVLGDE